MIAIAGHGQFPRHFGFAYGWRYARSEMQTDDAIGQEPEEHA